MAIQLRYASNEPVQDRKRSGAPTLVGVACWMIAIFVLAMVALT